MKGASGRFSLGPWTVEPTLHRLALDGEAVRVEPKVMEVLVHLAARAPDVVSREELQEAVWGTEYASEDLPRRAVYELRKALRDDPKAPRFIETIPRAGYRLVAPVAPVDPIGPIGPIDLVAEGTAGPLARPRRWRGLALALAAALVAAAVLLPGFLRTDSEPAVSPRPVPLTTRPGLELDPAFSPDGSRVAYLRAPGTGGGAELTLQVQLVGTSTSLRLDDQAADVDHPIESPTWSPDGTEIAYLRWQAGEGCGIYRVPALGGSERKLLDLGRAGASGLAWSPDGRWLALGLADRDGEPLALQRIAVDTLERQRLTDPGPTLVGDKLPAWSPDGASLAFIRHLHGEASELRVMPASGGASRSLLPVRHKIADVDWSPDGHRLLVAIHDGGRHRIWSVDATTGAARRVPELGDDTRWISVARRGGRIAIGRARWEFGIHRYELASGHPIPVPGLSSTFYDEALDLSPDGQRVAMTSTRSGSPEIWVSDLEGSRPVRLTSFDGAIVGHPRWLPDGRALVFDADLDARSDLWTVHEDGTDLARLTGAAGDDLVPSVSRDGRWIYFSSDRSGSWEVWRVPAGGGEPARVTRSGGFFARESPDGAWLYFDRRKSAGLWRLRLGGDGAQERVLGDELPAWEAGNWAFAPEGVYFVTWGSGHAELALYAPDRHEIVRRFPLAGSPVQPSLALSPATGSALLAELEGIESDILVVEGFDG